MISEKNKILAVLAFAFLLRVVGIGFGLPSLYHQDEPIIVNHALSIGAGGWNTHFFVIPPFTIYLLFMAQALFFVIGKLLGVFGSPSDFALMFMKDPSTVYLIGRFLLGVCFGTATVWVLWLSSRRFFGERVAFWAALFLAVLPMHVQHSHYIYADIPLTFAVTLTFFVLFLILEKPSSVNYACFGALLGWAASIKYTALYFAPVLLVVHLMAQKKEWCRLPQLLKLVLAGVCCVVLFLLLAPFSLLDSKNFLGQLFHQSAAEGFSGFTHHMTYSIVGGTGILFTVLAIFGLFVLMRAFRSRGIVVVTFLLSYYFVNVYFSQRFARYMLPLTPLLALLAAVALESLRPTLKHQRGWVFFITLILGGELLLPSIYSDLLFLGTDTRTECTKWFHDHVEPGTVIAVDNRFFAPHLPSSEAQIREKYDQLGTSEKDAVRKKRLDYLLQASVGGEGYAVYQLVPDIKQATSPFLFLGPFVREDWEDVKRIRARYIVIHYSDLDETPLRLLRALSGKSTLVRSFSPYWEPSRRLSLDPEASTAAPHLPVEIFSRKSLGPYLEVYRIEGLE